MIDDAKVADLVSRVMARLNTRGASAVPSVPSVPSHTSAPAPRRYTPRPDHDRPIQRKLPRAAPELSRPTPPSTVLVTAPNAIMKSATGDGIYTDVDAACKAASASYEALTKMGFLMRASL